MFKFDKEKFFDIENNKFLHPSLIVLGLLILIFFPQLFLGKALFYRDLSIQDYPLTMYVIDTIKNGQFPLWNPYLFSGFPQMASLQPPIFYPTTYLFFILPFHLGLAFSLIIHLFLAWLGVYLLCRYWNFAKETSLIAGVIFAFSGFMFEIHSMYYILLAITWFTYIFLYTEKFLNNSNLKNFLLLVLFCSLQLATGRLDYFYFTQMFLWSWILYRLIDVKFQRDFLIKKIPLLILAFGTSILLLAIQIIPALELVQTTRRYTGMDVDIATTWSLHPIQLLQLAFDNLFGTVIDSRGISVLLTNKDKFGFFIYNLYIGIPAIFLALYALYKKDKKAIFFSIIALIFIIFSLGNFTPIYKVLYNYLPGFSLLRYPIKLIFIPIFCIAIMAITGLELFIKEENKIRFYKISLVSLISMTAILVLSFIFRNSLISSLSSALSSYDPNSYRFSNLNFLFESVLFSLAVLGVFTLLIASLSKGKITVKRFSILMVTLICLDLSISNISNLYLIDKNDFYKKAPISIDIDTKIGDKNLYKIFQSGSLLFPIIDSSRVISDYKNNLLSMNYNLSMLYKFQNVYGYYPGEPNDIIVFTTALLDQYPNIKLSSKEKADILKMMGVRFIVWSKYNKKFTDNQNYNFLNLYPNGLELWEVKNYQPKISFKTKAVVADSQAKICEAIMNSKKYNLNINETAFIFYNDEFKKASSLVPKSKDSKIKENSVKLVKETANTLILDASVSESGYLIIANRFDKGWKALDNGKETPILKANYYQQGIRIGSGNHKIELVYKPASFTLGLKISLVTLMLLLISLVFLAYPQILKKKEDEIVNIEE